MRRLALLFFLAVCLAAGVAAWGWHEYSRPGPLDESTTVFIEQGSGARAISHALAEAGVVRERLAFLAAVRIRDDHGRLRAGEYIFPAHASLRSVIDKLVAGDTIVRRLTIAEGLTAREALAAIERADGLVGPVPPVEEGTLLPDTYHYSRGDSRAELVERMQRAMATTVERLWAARPPDLPLATPLELVTLASIVEKETGVAEERSRVAAVFINRLRKGMPLQSDPTVVYALERDGTALDRPLLRSDLAFDSPYNTYGNGGLPPGPIANPGLASLEAVIRPVESDELYFVADGSGGHAFARTLAEHNRNVRRWRQIRQKK